MIYNETSLSRKAEAQQFSLQVIIVESYLMSVGFLQESKKIKGKRQDLVEDVFYYADTHITELFCYSKTNKIKFLKVVLVLSFRLVFNKRFQMQSAEL